jgi:hypothetical protein
MTKHYYIEAKLHANRWTLLHTERSYKVALQYVREHASVRYPIRVVKVTRTIVFEEIKNETTTSHSKSTRSS